MSRLEKLKSLVEFHHVGEPRNTAAWEDIEPFLTEEEPLARYVLITEHDEITYAIPGDWDHVTRYAKDYVADDIYAERPLHIYDLDSGQRWDPRVELTWVGVPDGAVRLHPREPVTRR